MQERPLVLKLSGELEGTRLDEFEQVLAPVREVSLAVLDLSECRSLDAAFLSALARLRRNRRRDRLHMRFVTRSAGVRRTLELSGLSVQWPVYESVSRAICSLADLINASSRKGK